MTAYKPQATKPNHKPHNTTNPKFVENHKTHKFVEKYKKETKTMNKPERDRIIKFHRNGYTVTYPVDYYSV